MMEVSTSPPPPFPVTSPLASLYDMTSDPGVPRTRSSFPPQRPSSNSTPSGRPMGQFEGIVNSSGSFYPAPRCPCNGKSVVVAEPRSAIEKHPKEVLPQDDSEDTEEDGDVEEEDDEEDEVSSLGATVSPNGSPSTTISATTVSAPLGNGFQASKYRQPKSTTKGASLKRVSFGSSKGSMVETLIYDHTEHGYQYQKQSRNSLHETTDYPKIFLGINNHSNYQPPRHYHCLSNSNQRQFGDRHRAESESTISVSSERPFRRYRVALYESQKPTTLTSPDSVDGGRLLTATTTPNGQEWSNANGGGHNHQPLDIGHQTLPNHHQRPTTIFERMEGSYNPDVGLDNPFRPGGELEREAETIVNLIKEGKPITPTGEQEPQLPPPSPRPSNGLQSGLTANSVAVDESPIKSVSAAAAAASPKSPSTNGLNGSTKKAARKGVVDVQRAVIANEAEAPAPESVEIKKKDKCRCCVIQ